MDVRTRGGDKKVGVLTPDPIGNWGGRFILVLAGWNERKYNGNQWPTMVCCFGSAAGCDCC